VYGGGWTIGDLDSEDAVCQTLCRANNVVVVFGNLESLGGKSDYVIIGGLSAGANIAAALVQRARENNRVSSRGQILRVPLVVHPAVQPANLDFSSYKENAEAPFLPTTAVMQLLDWYNPVPDDVRMSPLLATGFSGLPPAYMQIAGVDPLRDDGFAYAEKVPVRVSVYPGLPHGFTLFPIKTKDESDQDLIQAVKWLIGDE
ncbi:Alpha/Beta hydrolase protein, partial [Ilyonectria destructans]